ncbi:cation diffusion facilitator family transporter [Rugosimonospora africana]|uniref:Cation diffusion facilitator transporter n=1 Tax=Rugosimonospora africana TaxID=556532 RepID=A0A8J3VNG5_9ACTN|nr:cation diffusion facilitator family transporter [Rugosimonospora africana]GIH12955.1 cation diffusion facilitator transporter [Rugosimonospora africana]
MTTAGQNKSTDGSTLTVLLALAANLGIAILKALAGLLTGSAALLSEAAHSVGDTVTELLLLTALRRSRRPADRRHPFGYGKERFFWSLLAAVGILVSGAAFSFYEGYRTLRGEGGPEGRDAWVGYVVLALSAVLESISFSQGVRQLRAEAARLGETWRSYLRTPRDPTVKSVVLEDSAALIGILLAFAGLALHQATGSAVWDGSAALAISALLVVVAYQLAQTSKGLLIGQQANIKLVRGIRIRLAEQPEVEKVVDILTMIVGSDRILLCARLDFRDTLNAADLERACVRIDGTLREEFNDLDEVFLEPVPRNDPVLRARVLARYGDILERDPRPAPADAGQPPAGRPAS